MKGITQAASRRGKGLGPLYFGYGDASRSRSASA